MRKFISAILAIAVVLVVSATAFADPISITTLEDLIDNSTAEGTFLTLGAKTFTIDGLSQIDLTGHAYPNLAISDSLSDITIFASSSPTGYRLTVNDLFISAGSLIAHGGNIDDASGILVQGDLVQIGTSIITAYGGYGVGAYGIVGDGELSQKEESNIIAIGGDGYYALGIWVNSLIQEDASSILVNGGAGEEAHGILVDGDLTQSGTSSIDAHAGEGNGAYGIYVEGDLTQSGTSSITAYGGETQNKIGVAVNGDLTQNDTSSITAYGGGATDTFGLALNGDLTQNDTSSITGHGGVGESAYGIGFTNLTQNDASSITGYGGKGRLSRGIFSTSITQEDTSSIIAYGGEGLGAYGIISDIITQSSTSSITAYGGKGEDAYGIFVSELKIYGKLIIGRVGEAASVVSPAGVTPFYASSTLVPIVDLSKSASLASGIIQISVVEIDPNAKLVPLLVNTYEVETGDKLSDIPFLISSGTIDGSFIEPSDTITFSYVAYKSGTTYMLEITREMTPKEAFKGSNENVKQVYVDFVDELYNMVLKSKENTSPSFLELLDAIDNSVDIASAINAINTTNEYVSQVKQWNDVMVGRLDGNNLSMNTKIGSLTDDGYGFSIDGSYMFGKNVSIPGIDLGFLMKMKNLSLLVQGQIALGSTKDDSKGTMYGVTSILNYKLNFGGLFNPEIGVIVSYMGNSVSDGTSQRAFRVGLDIANSFKLGSISLKPMLGISYTPITHIMESDDAKLTYLNGRIGVEAGYQTGKLSIKAAGYVSMNFSSEMSLEERIDNGEGILAVANYISLGISKVSWGLGVDVKFMVIPGFLGIEASYGIHAHGDYMSHTVKAGVNMAF